MPACLRHGARLDAKALALLVSSFYCQASPTDGRSSRITPIGGRAPLVAARRAGQSFRSAASLNGIEHQPSKLRGAGSSPAPFTGATHETLSLRLGPGGLWRK